MTVSVAGAVHTAPSQHVGYMPVVIGAGGRRWSRSGRTAPGSMPVISGPWAQRTADGVVCRERHRGPEHPVQDARSSSQGQNDEGSEG
ncbi:hypothetical protein [Arthrobacter sp. D5-1]|uniref:hypothetical protein n=1 Tax=Arthrobacter sp. D5-1 TaxID=1477518 RepID=UPI001A988D59|nr:hypothetical protein [Arthrobacter sp. D5-1]